LRWVVSDLRIGAQEPGKASRRTAPALHQP
jgi:hypothetical protein